jgi:hypothetical protein
LKGRHNAVKNEDEGAKNKIPGALPDSKALPYQVASSYFTQTGEQEVSNGTRIVHSSSFLIAEEFSGLASQCAIWQAVIRAFALHDAGIFGNIQAISSRDVEEFIESFERLTCLVDLANLLCA